MSSRVAILALTLAAACSEPAVEVALSDVRLRVSPSEARITILRPDGSVILDSASGGSVQSGKPPQVGFAFEQATPTWTELYGSFQIVDSTPAWQGIRSFSDVAALSDGISFSFDGGSGSIRRVADGTLALMLSAPAYARASAAFRSDADERYLGFGAMPMDVEFHGQTVPIWASEGGIGRVDTDEQAADWFYEGTRHQSYFPVPFFVSSHDYGVRADTSNRSVFAMGSEAADRWRVEAWESTLALHIFYGATPLDVIARHSDLEGRAPTPPAFTFAPWNDAIFGSASVRKVANVLRANHIPSSVIWTEDWAGGISAGGGEYYLPYDWSVDRTLYPDVEQLASDLHGGGFKFLAYFNSFVVQGGPAFAPGQAGHDLVEDGSGAPYVFPGLPLGKSDALVDLSGGAAAEWMSVSMNVALDLGFDGWMADFGEYLPVDAKLASGASGLSEHNRYPLEWQRLSEEVLSARNDGVDRIAIVRSGQNGSQPVSHQIVWGGDQNTDWDVGDGMPSVLPIMIGLGVAGMPYFGSDIGGYTTMGDTPLRTKELFFRWTELGALSPVMRTHHGTNPTLEWSFDSDAETLAHYKRWAQVHMQLYPYLAAASLEASQDGAPIARQLALGFPDDATAWTTADEYLFGPSLLVAPVLSEGATDRMVYFPAGHWVPLFGSTNGAAVDGPATIDVAAPTTELPLFAQSGTVLALLPNQVDTLAPATPPLVGLADVHDDREVIAVVGSAGRFQEIGGQTYALASITAPSAQAMLTWNGSALSTCGTTPVAPCASRSAEEAIAYVNGDGTLAWSDGSASLTTSAGAAGRALELHFRW